MASILHMSWMHLLIQLEYTTEIPTRKLNRVRVRVMTCLAQSPDLNIIEKLWVQTETYVAA